MKVKSIIIGCGQVAGGYDNNYDQKIRTHAKAYQLNNKVDLSGVCDKDIEKARKFAKKWKIKYFTNSIDEILNDCKPDLVSICTNTDTHYEVIKKVIKSGVRKIWLEKPATKNLNQTLKIFKLAKENKVKITISYYRSHLKEILSLKKKFPLYGRIQSVNCLYTKGLENNGSHLLDLLLRLFGNNFNVTSVNKFNDKIYPLISFSISNKFYNIDIKSLHYKYYEIFEIDINFTKGRIIITDGGRSLHFFKAKKNKYNTNYFNLELVKTRNISFDYTFKNILLNILFENNLSSLQDEIEISKLINKIKNNS